MNHHDYQNLPGISSHGLMEILKSPGAYYRKYLDPNRPAPVQTEAMRLGTLVHTLALTPEHFAQHFIVADYERRSLAGKARYAQFSETGLTPVKRTELDQALAIVAALHTRLSVRRWLQRGKKERTVIQPRQRGLLPLKARLDLHDETQRRVVEFKTTWNLTAVQAAMERYRYPLSAALYQGISRAREVLFVFVQTTPPYETAVMPMERPQLQAGREQYQTALQRFDACWLKGEWPEAEPVLTDFDDDPLMMPASCFPTAPTRPRNDLPLGELAL